MIYHFDSFRANHSLPQRIAGMDSTYTDIPTNKPYRRSDVIALSGATSFLLQDNEDLHYFFKPPHSYKF